ncbi:MAG: DNA polymerase III subunit alpha [Candidatus Rokubacteria bacterium RIFCSPHIGHO2_12_FULL_73_22]|nr:MAG: DNA polymerase III subunit alpha [Candidatus Rokubacteria bacterium RIFCSPHIGHO2_12_FULL_73_22]OGL02073.1 MAG: DNA polymerase III subunit alpha [Candidatus Rokubacteria bacterium RIFCSPHIGHO2_02_FULL_73_26]OGL09259.1 MAG: DNA polymerase III subunit alpha [Candidatus Rokubacteria bacterium RIFCSPLOWO2_02_FULL_73_56]OGL29101.1 MAG: DNA polymerase III subunit alpha [Candidatus Rokubacteria bacterium RIFCSPLOWO2_12_FULL_73_47]
MHHSEFVHLHVHSEYSLLDGAAQLEKLVARAKALRFPAIALTDHGNLFGAIDFYLAAQKAGVKPILGCELYVAPGSRKDRGSQDGGYEGANHLTVLVRNRAGYRNLIKLVSKAYLEGFYYKPRVDRELLAQHADGLLVLSGCLNSEVSRLLSAGDAARAREVAGWYQEVFGRAHYFMEVQAHGLEEQVRVTAATLEIARALGAPVVGTNDSHYLEGGHAHAHEALLCIQTGTTLGDPGRFRFSTQEFYVKSAEEMARVFAELPEACRNTLAVAERCNLTLDFGAFHLPHYVVPEEHTRDSYLGELARAGLRRRYGPSPGDALEARLAHELAVIEKMGFAGYFLVVWDFIHYARQQGIAVGPGRGSSAGSLTAYCLGITNIDPMRYGLLFERFLNPERISMPDMDIDFSDDRRDEVIRYVAERYGRDRVAHIITFGTLGAKAAIRDVGRVLGMPYADVDRIAKLVPNFPLNITLDDAYQKSPALAEQVKGQPHLKELWDIARTLEGCTRHASVHASAVVISDDPLDEHIPLYRDPKRPELITGYAMGPIEKLGLLKMDFLGLRTLTVLANTVALVRESRGVPLDLDTIPLDDARAYELLAEAKTFGVFQLESSGMRDALRGLKPERLEDLIAMVSLYRPGPMDLIPDFIARKHGRSRITYEHPAMEKFTRETYGIMVYQEQIMQIASEMAGFTMGEADTLRRAMGKKDRELMGKQRDKFLAGCAERGTPAAKADHVWELMEKFAGYGFNKSHAAAYALVAYQTAYFKANYPVEFMAALLTSEMGDTDRIVKYIEECRAMGLRVEPPDVNVSAVRFSVAGDTIRFGLAAIKNVGEAAMASILATRAEVGPFTTLEDFCARVDLRLVNRRVLESLIKAGAFDSLGLPRAHLLAAADAALESGQRQQRDRAEGQASFFELLPSEPARASGPAVEVVPEWDDDTRLAGEKEVLGFYVSGHPLARYRDVVDALGITTLGDLGAKGHGARVLLFGHVGGLKETQTKSGNRMAFFTLEDMDGTVDVTVFPEPFRASAPVLRAREPVLVRGRVDDGEKGRVVLAEDIRPLEQALADGSGRPRGGAAGGEPNACRIRVAPGEDAAAVLAAVRQVCAAHPGGVPVFLHLVLPAQEVVVRARGLSVDGSPALVARGESVLGPGAVSVEYAGRA